MAKTKIDWCDMVLNPAWGCGFKCSFCYARKFAKRFGRQIAIKEFEYRIGMDKGLADYLKDEQRRKNYISTLIKKLTEFEPVVVLHSNLNRALPKRPQRIFVNSMSDIAFWPADGWLHSKVIEKAKQHRQHTFLFLSKAPHAYHKFFTFEIPENMWFGVTVTNNRQLSRYRNHLRLFKARGLRTFISIEPMFERIDTQLIDPNITDWVIVGAQTNPYRPPEKKWVEEIVSRAKELSIPVFLKNNLKRICEVLIKQFPQTKFTGGNDAKQ